MQLEIPEQLIIPWHVEGDRQGQQLPALDEDVWQRVGLAVQDGARRRGHRGAPGPAAHAAAARHAARRRPRRRGPRRLSLGSTHADDADAVPVAVVAAPRSTPRSTPWPGRGPSAAAAGRRGPVAEGPVAEGPVAHGGARRGARRVAREQRLRRAQQQLLRNAYRTCWCLALPMPTPPQNPHTSTAWVTLATLKCMGSCHKRQKPQAPTPQAPICNRQTRKVANAKGLNRNTNLT